MDTQSDLTMSRIGERRMLLQLAGICGLLIVGGASVATVATMPLDGRR